MTAVQASHPFRTAVAERRRGRGTARSWLIPVVVALSVAIHLCALGLLTLPRRQPSAALTPDTQGTVELLMEEVKGAAPSVTGDQAKPAKPDAKAVAASPAPPPKPPQEAKPAPAAPPPPLSVADGDQPAPPEQPKQQAAEPSAPAAPAPTPAPKASPSGGLVMELQGTDSDSSAIPLWGVLPASPDDRFRNRPPPYPDDAARRGDQGDVVVTVHVAANGLAEAAEVVESSGSASLDRAAVTALRKWRFHPAMKDGQPVPFDFTINISFRP